MTETFTPTLTVAALIELLSQQDQSLEVWGEGCDCWNRITGIDMTNDGRVLLTVDTKSPDYYAD